ncbi:helix-turn-helix domain-containing protein [Micromonospora carbonacea]|uniref:Helix-turn-helix domain-containing protein n=1 Tax=Micromonospora carbonacea TaxID=47853 RepID=A0A1C5AZ97_9ACTN|nr:helix-turn-helix transcriptional regulator [Micromonospora carbonacea]SCF50401.1 Helix-turn-helix domain-containing protein [Micromonospora carbonacea]
MTHQPRTPRAQPQRAALGRRLRAHRLALGLTSREIATHIGSSHSQMTSIETTKQDVLVGTLIAAAEAVGLNVALAGDHHLPLLALTAAEVRALVAAASAHADESADAPDPALLDALDRLTSPATVDTTPTRPHRDEPPLTRRVVNVHLPAADIPA